MASIVNDPNGRKQILFVAPDGERGAARAGIRSVSTCQHVNEPPRRTSAVSTKPRKSLKKSRFR
jgi:hypothetical protein